MHFQKVALFLKKGVDFLKKGVDFFKKVVDFCGKGGFNGRKCIFMQFWLYKYTVCIAYSARI